MIVFLFCFYVTCFIHFFQVPHWNSESFKFIVKCAHSYASFRSIFMNVGWKRLRWKLVNTGMGQLARENRIWWAYSPLLVWFLQTCKYQFPFPVYKCQLFTENHGFWWSFFAFKTVRSIQSWPKKPLKRLCNFRSPLTCSDCIVNVIWHIVTELASWVILKYPRKDVTP